MPSHDYTLFDLFQEKGYWWLPETPDRQVPGILFRSEQETRLELFGDLYEESLAEKGIVKQPRPVPIILGWIEDQGVCTLYKNHRTSERLSVPGGASSTNWSSQVILVGKHFPEEDTIAFTSMGVNYTNLEEWVSEPPFKAPDRKMDGDKLIGYETAYVARDPMVVDLPTLEATLKIECAPRFIHGFSTRTQEYADFVSLYPRLPKEFDWYLTAFKDCAGLLTLLIGQPVYEKRVIGYVSAKEGDADTDEKEVTIFFHHKNRLQSEPKHPYEMLASLPMFKHWFTEAFKKWFENSSTLRDVYNLFFSSLYSPGAFLQSEFLSLVQSLESFSRTRGTDLYVSEETYKGIKDRLLAAIPEGIDEALKASLEGHIQFGNQHSLKRRVDAILGSLDGQTLKLFCPDSAAFRKKIVDTRNYLAHFDVKSKKKALHGTHLWVANQRLRLLLTILLLKETGFNEDAIRERLRTHPKWMQLIHLYLERPEY
jgi:hypothetical protein